VSNDDRLTPISSEEFVAALLDPRPLLEQSVVQQVLREMGRGDLVPQEEDPWTRLRRLHAELLTGDGESSDEESARPRLTLIQGGEDVA